MADKPAQAFLSYAHADDAYLNGGITWLREEMQRAMQAITGEPFEIFQDADGLAFGEHWPSRVEEALTAARFLIPILTPSYFNSDPCREEAEFFLRHEKKHKRRDLILPIYLIEADVLEDSAKRAGDYLARQFYERQYADWRDAAFDLHDSRRFKQRAFDLAKQIKAASERTADDAPPIVPAQGPGIRFGLDRDGKLDRAPDEPSEVTDDDPRLCSLQEGLQDACNRFLDSFEGGEQHNVSAAHSPLIDNVRAYQDAITGKLTELQFTEVYRRGVTLQNQMLARSRDVPRMDPPPPLEDQQEVAINDLLTFHGNFILSTKDGEALQAQADRAHLTAEERAKLWSPALSHAVQASDHATERAKAILADVNQPDDEGAVPDRRALLALATNRNFLSATGEAATGKDFSNTGEETATAAGHAAGRFLLKNKDLVTRLATSAPYALSWLTPLITYLRGRRAPAATVRPASEDAPAIVTNDFWTPRRVFRDVDEPWCPEMVVIPAGAFMMGSPEDEKGRNDCEGPQRRVIIKKPLALGRYPVTFDEYDLFCDKTNRDKPDDAGWGRGRRPVINVSWHDAKAYCDWLSERLGRRYRLPSEAEWEYACRAGSRAAYAFGETIDERQANFDEHVGKTSEVGAYPANAFKLYDMHGNVWEWCESHFFAYGGGHLPSEYEFFRADRGGGWHAGATAARAASRNFTHQDQCSRSLGFRCALVQK
ncbi:MAG: SUMF1/EgtB/PvdO family nonheme iron enzyme [Alphaproteobacteria bacterium]|nr:SUMF1/EgtB/PvdO family nonheme iron enzyme [Alphaproteobacteria bacterium]